MSECAIAADKLGITFRGEKHYSYYPRGCIYNDEYGSGPIYWNTRSSTSWHDLYGVICRDKEPGKRIRII